MSTPSLPAPNEPCPCGAGIWGACCGPVIAGDTAAATAEAVMRSRYSAFVVGDAGHLLRSWHPDTRPDEVTFVADQTWTSLEIVSTERGRALDATGIVEFRARYRRGNRAGELHEASRFGRVGGRWVYIDGDVD
jgi:SEC-C motif domain protein